MDVKVRKLRAPGRCKLCNDEKHQIEKMVDMVTPCIIFVPYESEPRMRSDCVIDLT